MDRAEKDLHRQLSETQSVLGVIPRYQQRIIDLRAELANAIQVLNSSMRDLAHAQAENQLVSFKALLSKLLRQFKLLLTGQRAAQHRTHNSLLNDVDAAAASNLFDPAWYLRQRPDVAASGINPLVHYVQHGAAESCNPGPLFDAVWYLNRYPDVAAAGMNPFLHYVRFGKAEHREIRTLLTDSATASADNDLPAEDVAKRVQIIRASPLFDSDWYLKKYPDVASSGLDPVHHYLRFGALQKLNPGPDFDAAQYLKMYPDVAEARLNPLLHYLEYGRNENRFVQLVEDCTGTSDIIRNHFREYAPIVTFSAPSHSLRVTMVTDSINDGSLNGGLETALILVTLLANRLNADIRIVTRLESPAAASFAHVLSANGIEWTKDVEFVYSQLDGSRPVGVSDNDLFITTSWLTTKAVRQMIDPARIFYLLQEDERMFYPFGDRHLRCEETLADADIRFLINSELLFEHLTTGPESCTNIIKRGMWFEPAFPRSTYYPEQNTSATGKRQFFFDAHPDNIRNLYWRGLETLESALENKILRRGEWDFHFVGRELSPVRLPGRPVIQLHENLQWSEYVALVRQMDLALSLIDNPHPGYPPLHLAASGAVVVTNARGVKTNLDKYSENIICANPSVDSLLAGLASATKLVNDHETRQANFLRSRVLRDWHPAFEPVLRHVSELVQSEIR